MCKTGSEKEILDGVQIHGCNMIYDEHYGKHTRLLTLETAASKQSDDCEAAPEHTLIWKMVEK